MAGTFFSVPTKEGGYSEHFLRVWDNQCKIFFFITQVTNITRGREIVAMLNSGVVVLLLLIVALLLLIIVKSINLLRYINEDIEISHLIKQPTWSKI